MFSFNESESVGLDSSDNLSSAIVIPSPSPDYLATLRSKLWSCNAEFVIISEPHHTLPPAVVNRLIKEFGNADLINISDGINRSTTRGVLNRVLKHCLKIPISDFITGVQIYRRSVLQEVVATLPDIDCSIDLLVHTYCEGHTVVETGVKVDELAIHGGHAVSLSDVPYYLRTLFRLWRLRNSVVSADYDARAYDSWIPLQRYWQRKRFDIVKRYLGEVRGEVLDIGCGSSKIAQSLPESVAVDISLRKLRYLSATNSKRILASTFELPFKNEVFEGLIHSQVIEHIPYEKRIYTELHRVLKPGAVLVIGTPDYGRIWWPIIEYFYHLFLPNAYADEHITHYTYKSLTDELKSSGFQVIEHGYICGGELIVKALRI